MALKVLVNIGSGNGLWPNQHQAFTWTNDDSLLISPLQAHLSKIVIKIQQFLFVKMHWKMSSANGRQICPGLNKFETA